MLRLLSIILTAVVCIGSCSNKPEVKQPIQADMQTEKTGNPYYSRTDTTHLNVSDAEWKKVLPEDVYYISREKGTEYAFSGKYNDFDGLGTYYCAACGNALFKSDSKFASSCGWPSFY